MRACGLFRRVRCAESGDPGRVFLESVMNVYTFKKIATMKTSVFSLN